MADLKYYEQKIQEITQAPAHELPVIEEIMREDILHSTLDWLSPGAFRIAAKDAYRLLQLNRSLYEKHYPQLQSPQEGENKEE